MANSEKVLKPGQQFVFRDPVTHEGRQYTLVRALSRGTFAQSFLASGERGYAVLKSSVNAQGEDLDLGVEAKVLSGLDHANVVRYLGTAFDHKWRIVLAFERLFDNPLLLYNREVDVASLSDHPGGHYFPLPLDMALDLFMDLLCGLEYLHDSGVVHADVKLANFMFDLGHEQEESVPPEVQLQDLREGCGHGVLIDVGGCWTFDDLRAHNEGRSKRKVQLTPAYAPPEALLADNKTGSRRGRILHPTMDTYAAALTAYVTLTGQLPYAHLGKRGEDLVEAKRHERRGELSPLDLGAIRGIRTRNVHLRMRERELTARLEEFLLGCVHPDPSRRPTVSKARAQLEEAFGFVAGDDGRLRQSVAEGVLEIPGYKRGARPSGGAKKRVEGSRGLRHRRPAPPPIVPRGRRRAAPRTVFWLRSPVFSRPLALQPGRPYVLGRAGNADLPIPSDRISRLHASLEWKQGRLQLSDLGSTNGTRINGVALVEGRPIPLRDGVRFSVGGFEIEVLELEEGQRPVAPSHGVGGPTRPMPVIREPLQD
jgi:serine/threonine protein kinase